MVGEILPYEISEIIKSRFNEFGIYEIRVRANKPIMINYYGDYIELRDKNHYPICADKKLLDYILLKATEMSVYRYNNQIKQGFITTASGLRVGLAGEIVLDENNSVRTIKNLSAVVIRVPHEVKNSASHIMPYIVVNGVVKNTLIIAPPGRGKTTIIRDIARNLSSETKVINSLIVDERYEIACVTNGECGLDVGEFSDVISGGAKSYSFGYGIRSLRPDVIITDEIGGEGDLACIKKASLSGVKVIATIHATNEQELKRRNDFNEILRSRIFERFVVLSSRKGMGTVEYILNGDLDPIVDNLWLFCMELCVLVVCILAWWFINI